MSVSSAAARDGTLVISVEDSGSGMSRAEIAEIMQQGDAPAPKRRAGGGLGLGLPLVRALAEANGASLSLESEPGRGTKAKIVFTGNADQIGLIAAGQKCEWQRVERSPASSASEIP